MTTGSDTLPNSVYAPRAGLTVQVTNSDKPLQSGFAMREMDSVMMFLGAAAGPKALHNALVRLC